MDGDGLRLRWVARRWDGMGGRWREGRFGSMDVGVNGDARFVALEGFGEC